MPLEIESKATLDEVVDRLRNQLDEVVTHALSGAQNLVTSLNDSMNGWRLSMPAFTIAIKQAALAQPLLIEIPKIEITLRKP